MRSDEALRAVALADPAAGFGADADADADTDAIAGALLARIDADRRGPASARSVPSIPTSHVGSSSVLSDASWRDTSSARRAIVSAMAAAAAIALLVFAIVNRGEDPNELDVIDAPPISTSIAPSIPEATTVSVAPQPISQTQAAIDFIAAVRSGDLDALARVIAADASCETLLPGPDTCSSFWGANAAMGARIELRNCRPEVNGQFEERCDLSMTSELHSVFGFDGFDPGGEVLLRTDRNGLLIPFPVIDVDGAFLDPAGRAELRLWEYMDERYPELRISPFHGPIPYDYESGLKMLEAARELNDPIRIAADIEAGVAAGASFEEVIQRTGIPRFLDEADASIDIDCSGLDAEKGEVICPATLTTEIHEILGSGTVDTTVRIRAVGGALRDFDPEIRFFDDPARNEEFVAFAIEQGVRSGSTGGPVYNLGTLDDWLAAAAAFD